MFYRRPSGTVDFSSIGRDQTCAEVNMQEITQPFHDSRKTSSLNVDEPEEEHQPNDDPVEDPEIIVPAETDIPCLTPDQIDIDWMFDSFLNTAGHDWAELLTGDVSCLGEETATCETRVQDLNQPNEQHHDQHRDQTEDNWSDYQSFLHRELCQLDTKLLNSAFFDPDNLKNSMDSTSSTTIHTFLFSIDQRLP
jgi:hypothetical protein